MERSYSLTPYFSSIDSGTFASTTVTHWPLPSSAAVVAGSTYPYYLPDPLVRSPAPLGRPAVAETDPLAWLRRRVDEICWQPPSR